MDIKRYNVYPEKDKDFGGLTTIENEEINGDYCLCSDIEPLIAENKRLREEKCNSEKCPIVMTSNDTGIPLITLVEENKRLREASRRLLFLNGCEQEGISSGMPTPDQWEKAFEDLEKATKGNK